MNTENNQNNTTPDNAPEHCPGTASEQAGKSSACDGCPNQSICASGETKGPDPDVALIRDAMKLVKHKLLVLSGKGGVGKCWGKGTGILKYDGTIRHVEDLKFGDLLMGDDGTPRRIISEPIHGKGQMYRITPSSQAPGRPFSCNDEHILVLRLGGEPHITDSVCGNRCRARVQYLYSDVDDDGDVIVKLRQLSREYGPNKLFKNYDEAKAELEIALHKESQKDNYVDPDTYIWEVRAEAFFEKVATPIKNLAKMYMPGAISFPAREGFLRSALQEVLSATPTDDKVRAAAYLLGSWLGDGSSAAPVIYVAASETEQLNALHHAIELLGCGVTVSDCKGDGTFLGLRIKAMGGNGRNPFLDLLRSLNVYKNKHIPEELALDELVNVRHHLLAGLLDTDGCFYPTKATYKFVQKRKQITDMVHRMANNSGFRSNDVARAMKIASNGKRKEKSEYWRCDITGPDMSMLPISIPRKRDPGPSGRATKPNKRHTVWGFTITKLDRSEEEDYYGFTVDGNNRLLLADNTVTHNSTVSAQLSLALALSDRQIENIRKRMSTTGDGMSTTGDGKSDGDANGEDGVGDEDDDFDDFEDDDDDDDDHVSQVGVMDIDLCGPSIPRMFGLEGREIRGSSMGWTPVYYRDNLAVVSIGFMLPNPDDAVIWRGPKKNGLIKQFLRDVHWGEVIDYLVVDTPPGTSDEHLTIVQYLQEAGIDGAILVTTPQDVACQDVRREISFCKKVNVPILGIVENMSGFVCSHCNTESKIFRPTSGGGEGLAKEYGIPFLGRIPLDPTVMESCETGKSILVHHPESLASKSFFDIVLKVKQAVRTNVNGNAGNGSH